MLQWAEAPRNAAIVGASSLANGGALEFRTGPPPESPDDPPSGTLLVTVLLQDPAFGSAENGQITALGLPLTGPGEQGGDIGHVRVIDSGGNAVYHTQDVSTEPGHKVVVNAMTVSAGIDFQVNSVTLIARNPSNGNGAGS